MSRDKRFKSLQASFGIYNNIYHPRAKFMSISVVKICAKYDLFTRFFFFELQVPLQQVKSPLIGQTRHLYFIDPLPKQHLPNSEQVFEYVSGYCLTFPCVLPTSTVVI